MNVLFKKAEAQPNNKQIIYEIYDTRLRLKSIISIRLKMRSLEVESDGTSLGFLSL